MEGKCDGRFRKRTFELCNSGRVFSKFKRKIRRRE